VITGLVLSALLFGAVYFPTLTRLSIALVSPYAKADVPKRLAAAAIDGVPIVVSGLFYWSSGSVALPLIGAAYMLLRDGVRGQSVGKLWLGLVVMNLRTGRPCTLKDSLWRNALFLIPGANLVAVVLEAVTLVRDPQGQRLGDRIAHTQVIEGLGVKDLAASFQQWWLKFLGEVGPAGRKPEREPADVRRRRHIEGRSTEMKNEIFSRTSGGSMIRRIVVAAILGAAALAAPSLAIAQQRAADGVVINDEGQPQYSTFSLCAIDPATGQSGAAVTTRVPFVGRAVPWVRAGVGAVCTQASTMVEYGPRGLDLLAKGVEPPAVLTQLLADDAARESRQVGVIDMKGRAAAHTGKQNGNWAGSKQGRNYTVQANIMVGPEVVDAVAATFEATEGTGLPLAERMILALESGYAKGGDRRWGNLQSAAIKIADPNDPGRGNDYIALAIEVGEHADPVGEMKRIYYTTGRRLGYRSFSQVDGADVIELKRMLHALGYWRSSLAAFPDPPPSTNTRQMQDLRRTNPADYDKIVEESRRASAAYARDYAQYDAETIAAVDKFRADRNLNYQGNPAGLVDARFVDALRAAYLDKQRGALKK